MKLGNVIRWAIALALVALSFANASWLAPEPKGSLRLIAAASGDCPRVEDVRAAIVAGSDTTLIDAGRPGCPAVRAALEQLPRYDLLFRVTDPAATLAAFDRLRRPIDKRYGFVGEKAAIAAIRARHPKAWAFTIAEARRCFSEYVQQGWVTLTPESCRSGTIIVPIDEKWKVAGWPRRFQARMAAANTRVILAGPGTSDDAIVGLNRLEQIPEIPRVYTGYAWVDDIELIGRSIRR